MNLFKGTRLKGENGNTYIVEKTISIATGQGDIFLVHNERKEKYALKLFHKGDVKKLRSQIEMLIKRGQATDAYVVPIEIVEFDGRLGYIMEYIGKEYLPAAALFNGIEEDGRVVSLDWADKVALLYEIVNALCILNNANLGIMDVKFDNIKLDLESLKVKILDTDTIVYTGDKSIVLGTTGFMPPLTMIGKEKPNKYNDVYAVAVLIFMSLIGIHPLEGARRDKKCNENIDTYLFGTHPLYVFHPHDNSNRPIPQDGYGRNQQIAIDKMDKYPEYFRKAMEQTFVDGIYDGKKRVTLEEWKEILERLYGDGYICENCGEEYFFENTFKECKACGKELQKPIFLQCDKNIPLFNSLTVFSDELFATENHYEVFKVVVTKYDKRYGLENRTRGEVVLRLKNGEERTFPRGEVFPIFLDSEIEVENKKIKFV